MNGVDIVKLTPADWQAYKNLRLEALKTESQAFGATYADNVLHPDSFWQERLRDAALGTTSWLLFAQHGECLVGMLGAFVLDEGDVARVIAVYVTREARGQGISTRLMEALLNELRSQALLTKVTLSVNIGQAAALALYRCFGFEVVSYSAKPHTSDSDHDIYEMEKILR